MRRRVALKIIKLGMDTRQGRLSMVLVRITYRCCRAENKKNLCAGCGFYKHATLSGVSLKSIPSGIGFPNLRYDFACAPDGAAPNRPMLN